MDKKILPACIDFRHTYTDRILRNGSTEYAILSQMDNKTLEEYQTKHSKCGVIVSYNSITDCYIVEREQVEFPEIWGC